MLLRAAHVTVVGDTRQRDGRKKIPRSSRKTAAIEALARGSRIRLAAGVAVGVVRNAAGALNISKCESAPGNWCRLCF